MLVLPLPREGESPGWCKTRTFTLVLSTRWARLLLSKHRTVSQKINKRSKSIKAGVFSFTSTCGRHTSHCPVWFDLLRYSVLLGSYRLSGCNHRNTVVSLDEETENELVEVPTLLVLERLDGSFNLWCCPAALAPHLIYIFLITILGV